MAGMADDVIQRLQQMSSARLSFERAWQQVAEVAAPDASDFRSTQMGLNSSLTGLPLYEPMAAKRSRKIFDSTAVWAVDRLASGLEALIIPQSEYWHTYDVLDYERENPTDEEKAWLERLRNLTFKMRYDADSGFVTAMQTALRRLVAFGNAFVMVEDGIANRSVFLYRYIPLSECYIAEDHYGRIDTFKRLYSLTARQAVQKFGNRVSQEIQRAADKSEDSERRFQFIQAISPRGDFGSPSLGVKRAPFASIHIEYEKRAVVGESGFYEFPIIDFRWMPEPGKGGWGEGPVMKALSDIQSLNTMAKNELIAGQQAIDPPLLVANAGVMNRPNSNPGAINMGGLTPNGQRLVEPMMTGQRLDFATMVLEAKRNQVKESLYINLFALLVKNPQMSATEALIRANEKGELLGPAGSRIQQALSNMSEREIGIMTRRGVFAKGSAFRVPPTLGNKNIGAHFTSPLDRARKGKEVEGTIQLLNILSPLAQVDPTIVDNLDGDAMTRGLAERLGSPISFVRPFEMVQQVRAQRQQQQALAQQAEIAKSLASAGKQGVDALSTGKEAGIL